MDFHFHQIDLEALNDSISDLTVKKIVYFSQINLNLKKSLNATYQSKTVRK